MEHTTLGRTGTIVSRLALGTMDFGGLTSEEDAFAVLDAYVEAGGNLVDTANVYGRGASEETVGRWLASRPADLTDSVVLATKGRAPKGPGVNDQGASRRSLALELEGSLRRLGRDHVDLYQLHAWDPITPPEETIGFLDDAIRAGRIRYFGLSNFTGWQLQLMVSTAKAIGPNLPATIQQQYSLLSRESEWDVFPGARYNGVGILPWSPLANGFLTGKYRRDANPATGTRAAADNPIYRWSVQTLADSDRTWHTIDVLRRIAEEVGASPARVALSWLADRPGVVAPVIGARNTTQLADNLSAADLHLDAAATAALEEVSRPVPGRYPYGAFGEAQRARRVEGGVPLNAVVSPADA